MRDDSSLKLYALALISIRNRRQEDRKICRILWKEIDIVICLVKIACPGVCTYYHTITTRQRMIYDATTDQSTRKIMCLTHHDELSLLFANFETFYVIACKNYVGGIVSILSILIVLNDESIIVYLPDEAIVT